MDQFRKEAERMIHVCKGCIDKPNDPLARELNSQFQRIEDEAQMGKSPGTIRNRLKTLQRTIKSAANSQVINHSEAASLDKWAEDSIRKMR